MARTDDTARRIFLAVDLDDEVRHGLAAHLTDTAGKLPGSTPPPANWHITLRFLGKTEEPGYEVLLSRLDEADLGDSFTIGFDGLGAFPRPARATVLWLGVDRGAGELTQLATVVEEAVVSAGFMPEERPFHPHLTLSRIRPAQDVRDLLEDVPAFPLAQQAARLTLFESHLGGGPAVYQPLERFELD